VTDGRWLLVYGCAASADPVADGNNDHRLITPLPDGKTTPELYDLKADPTCLKDVIVEHKDRARELHRWLLAFLERSPMQKVHLELFRPF
jgi:hypothetical protein